MQYGTGTGSCTDIKETMFSIWDPDPHGSVFDKVPGTGSRSNTGAGTIITMKKKLKREDKLHIIIKINYSKIV
jgi:hypothetical protein